NEARHLEFPRHIKKDLRSQDVGANERARIVNAAIDVALGCEVENGLEPGRHDFADRTSIGDVAAYEPITGIGGNVREVVEVAGRGEAIEIDYGQPGIAYEQMANKIAANKAATAGYQDGKHACSLKSWSAGRKRLADRGVLESSGKP